MHYSGGGGGYIAIQLRGYYIPNQKFACFVFFLKINYTFLEK